MRALGVLLLLWSASLPAGRSANLLGERPRSGDRLRADGASARPPKLAVNSSERRWKRLALQQSSVRLDTTKGAIVIAVHRDWAPHGADRFLELVIAGYFDDARFFRVVEGQWAQFGINKDPKVST